MIRPRTVWDLAGQPIGWTREDEDERFSATSFRTGRTRRFPQKETAERWVQNQGGTQLATAA